MFLATRGLTTIFKDNSLTHEPTKRAAFEVSRQRVHEVTDTDVKYYLLQLIHTSHSHRRLGPVSELALVFTVACLDTFVLSVLISLLHIPTYTHTYTHAHTDGTFKTNTNTLSITDGLKLSRSSCE